MALVTVRAARGVESISDDALPQTASPPTPLVVAESLNDVVRHARVALVWIIVQAAAILDHEQPAIDQPDPPVPLQSGRAPGRERGCKSVKDQGGAEVLKKK